MYSMSAERTTDSLSYRVTDSPLQQHFSRRHILLQTTTLSGHTHTLDTIKVCQDKLFDCRLHPELALCKTLGNTKGSAGKKAE